TELEVTERRRLLEPEPPVLPRRLEADRREDDRQAFLTSCVEQPPRRLDLRGHLRAERAVGVGEAAREVDHDDARIPAERHRLAEPRLLVDLLGSLVAHAGTASLP